MQKISQPKKIETSVKLQKIKFRQQSQSEDTQKLKKLSDIIYESTQSSDTHGIKHIFKREKHVFIKCVWLICILASGSVCAWLMARAVCNYFEYETVSKTETINQIPTLFPTVSICNMNQFSTNYSLQFVQKILLGNQSV